MSAKEINVPGVGTALFYKRRNTRSIRIHIRGSEIRVTLPYWISYQRAIRFVASKRDWIQENKKDSNLYVDGSYIGKKHQLKLVQSQNRTIRSSLKGDTLVVSIPKDMDSNAAEVQKKIEKACDKVLEKECEELLRPYFSDLSLQTSLNYNDLSFKKLRSRWGSCDAKNNIVLNTYLVGLTWPQITYVMIHELAHTKEHNHSSRFWEIVAEYCDEHREIRKELRSVHPDIKLS